MKQNLGKLLLFLFVHAATLLIAAEYEWSAEVNKKEIVTNEAVYLKYVCTFVDESELYVIEFNPVTNNKEYEIELLSESEKIENGRRINSFEFVLFVKKAGEFKLNLETRMKKTNKESIENGVLGRDNANYEEFTITEIQQKPIELHVSDAKADLTGEFHLQVKRDESKIKAYVPYHLELSIEGVGNFSALSALVFTIEGVKIFAQKPQVDLTLTKDGYRGKWSQKFAFVAQSSFSVPGITIKFYDLKQKSLQSMVFKGVNVDVAPPLYKKEQLLDKEDESFSFSKEYIYYLFTFIAGFLAAKIKIKRALKKEDSFCKKIASFANVNELSLFLAMHDAKKYDDIILKIERKELSNMANIRKLICG